jgi:hypothetical protein
MLVEFLWVSFDISGFGGSFIDLKNFNVFLCFGGMIGDSFPLFANIVLVRLIGAVIDQIFIIPYFVSNALIILNNIGYIHSINIIKNKEKL